MLRILRTTHKQQHNSATAMHHQHLQRVSGATNAGVPAHRETFDSIFSNCSDTPKSAI
jgi:3-deoxy-D-manno-octulosonic-acid transferase